MLAALVVLIMIVVLNLSALFFCCNATYSYGLWLQTYHRKDLMCLRILVRHMVTSSGVLLNDVIPVLTRVVMLRSRMVWRSTRHGPPLPR